MKKLLYMLCLLSLLHLPIFTAEMPPTEDEALLEDTEEMLPTTEDEMSEAEELESPLEEEEPSMKEAKETMPPTEDEALLEDTEEMLPTTEDEMSEAEELESPLEEEPPMEEAEETMSPSKDEVTEEVETRQSSLSKLRITVNSFKEDLEQLRLNVEEIATLEKNLLDDLRIADDRRSQAARSAVEVGKIKRKILTASDGEEAKAHFNKIIELYGGVEQTKTYLEDLSQSFEKQVNNITAYMERITEKANNLEAKAQGLEEEVKAIGETEAKEAQEDEQALAKRVRAELLAKQTRKPIQTKKLLWYEKILSGSARGIIQLRDFIRSLFKVQPKEAVPSDKEEVAEEKTVAQLIRNIAADSFGLFKKGFYAIGHLFNLLLEKAAGISTSPKKQEATPTQKQAEKS